MNYKMTVQYDGTDYAGWQIQKNAVTVQQKIVEAVEIITKEKINLIGSGRTDSGVHALGQVANFKVEKNLDTKKFMYSLNAILPKDISVNSVEQVNEFFHSRFDAVSRSYLYFFSHGKSPFYDRFTYNFPHVKNIPVEQLILLSKSFLGEHDFTSLSKKNEEQEGKTCKVYEINWRRTGDKTIFYIKANRFLHGMVRTIVGTLVYAAEKKMDESYIKELLAAKDRTKAEESFPAKGLFLFKVRY